MHICIRQTNYFVILQLVHLLLISRCRYESLLYAPIRHFCSQRG